MQLGAPAGGLGCRGATAPRLLCKTQRLQIACDSKPHLAAYNSYDIDRIATVRKPRLWGGAATASAGCRLRRHSQRALRAALTDDAHGSEDAVDHQQQLNTAGYAQPVSRGRPARRSNALGYSALLSSFNAAAVQRLTALADYELDVLSKQMGYTFNHKEATVSLSLEPRQPGAHGRSIRTPGPHAHAKPTLRCKLQWPCTSTTGSRMNRTQSPAVTRQHVGVVRQPTQHPGHQPRTAANTHGTATAVPNLRRVFTNAGCDSVTRLAPCLLLACAPAIRNSPLLLCSLVIQTPAWLTAASPLPTLRRPWRCATPAT